MAEWSREEQASSLIEKQLLTLGDILTEMRQTGGYTVGFEELRRWKINTTELLRNHVSEKEADEFARRSVGPVYRHFPLKNLFNQAKRSRVFLEVPLRQINEHPDRVFGPPPGGPAEAAGELGATRGVSKMSQEEREQGRKWVEEQIRSVASERKINLGEPIEWHLDFDREIYWVRALMDGNAKVWKFSCEQLEDSVNDKRVQRDLQKQIRFFVHARSDAQMPQADQAGSPLPSVKLPYPAGESPAEGTAARIKEMRIFLCYSKADKGAARKLYDRMRAEGLRPWFDEEDLMPGQEWEMEITKAVRESDIVLVLLSRRFVERPGFGQKEIKLALDIAERQPEGKIFIIPVKLDECKVPERLRRWQWVNLFEANGYDRLLSALHKQAKSA